MKAAAHVGGSGISGDAKFDTENVSAASASVGSTGVGGEADFLFEVKLTPGDFPTYQGPYEVTPSVDGTTLETAQKLLTDNVEVSAIPYFNVGNTAGGSTVYIGTNIEVK